MTTENETRTEETPPPAPKDDGVVRIKKKLLEKKIYVEENDGTENLYTCREMMGQARDSFLDENAKRTKKDVKGNTIGTEYRGCQSVLISKCLYDQNDKLIPRHVIDSQFPATAQMTLFKICQEINGLDQDEAAEKKD